MGNTSISITKLLYDEPG